MLSFEKSQPDRRAQAFRRHVKPITMPSHLARQTKLCFPELSELEVLRHYTKLSQKNFSIDTHFYPLGSCTMKYNPRAANKAAMLPGFLSFHPLTHPEEAQGFMQCLYELQEMLADITGMKKVSLVPMAGAQGEFAGVAMIKAYHQARKDYERTEILVPDAAHGTNPASAAMCGFTVREIPTLETGDLDLVALQKAVSSKTAAIMLTNPSTLGVFERNIKDIAAMIHQAGGLLYYDGANLNAILGKYRPGDMGFDVIHLNLHKTFATPHGGGGPGAGPVAANERLAEFLPIPMIGKNSKEQYVWETEKEFPNSIGKLSSFAGNIGVLLRAYAYIRLLGQEGLPRVAEFATLNANYLMKCLETIGFPLAFPDRRATHEFIITVRTFAKKQGVKALDIAKRLLDYGFHSPTMYFPLHVPECLLIEPTETESKQTLDEFVNAMKKILEEIQNQPEILKQAPHTLPVRRLDEVKAARDLDIKWRAD